MNKMNNKNILIISAVFPPEPVTSATLNSDLAVALSVENNVTVITPKPSRPAGFDFSNINLEEEKRYKHIIMDSYVHPASSYIGRMKESRSFGNISAKYIAEYHDEIDFVYNDAWQLFGLYRIAKVCKKYRIPYMVPIQDIYPECLFTNKNYPGLLKWMIKTMLLPIDKYYQKHAACVRTISVEMRDYLSETRKVPKNNYLVVNNWQNDSDFLKEYPKRVDDGKIVFAYVGSINEHANVDKMIKAFAAADIPNGELRIYGGGNKKDECVKLVNNLGLKNVVFDMVSRDKVAYVQSQADVLILALPEGNGNLCLPSKMTSYMLSGKPVMASVDEDSATKRYIQEADCGIAVRPDDVEAIKEGFISFAKMSKENLKKKGDNSKAYSRQYLTREVNLNMVVERIKELLK